MSVFLHGFLGQKEDWDELISSLPNKKNCLAIDLPGHGSAPFHPDIVNTVKKKIPSAKTLIGYSAGGRLALLLKSRFPKDFERVIILSAHPGLHSKKQRAAREKRDQIWISLLESSFELFIEKWYAQPLFQSLKNHPILKQRRKQNPKYLAAFFKEFCLSKMPLPRIYPESIFLYGQYDIKYATLYKELLSQFPIFEVKNAGHAIHLENPKECSRIIEKSSESVDSKLKI